MRSIPLQFGEPVPPFIARSPINPEFHFDSVGGMYIVLTFFPTATHPVVRQMLEGVLARRERFDDVNAAFFGVTIDPADERSGRLRDYSPGIHFFWDFDRQVSHLCGAMSRNEQGEVLHFPHSLVLDPMLRVIATVPLQDQAERHVNRLLEILDGQPPIGPAAAAVPQAPVLVVPRIFEPELCRELIAYYEQLGGEESGFMREVNGMTVPVHDPARKRRRDRLIDDAALRKRCMIRIHDRLVPQIHKAFQFRATRIERYVVACYDAESRGHFKAHRDNTTRGTAHRRFAVSLMLNTGEYEGGMLRFPEFGPHLYAAPVGGAVVFSCSLLHEAMPVIRGKRYVFLPFLYDEEAARLREQNLKFVQTGTASVTTNSVSDPSSPQVDS